MKILCTAQPNYFYVYDPEWTLIAAGLYKPPANLPNHTCKPNLLHNFFGRNVVLIAKEVIEYGDDLTISYQDGCDMGVKQRNDYFDHMSDFRCWCDICKEEKDTSDERT